MMPADRVLPMENAQTGFQGVFQFSDVSRPAIAVEHLIDRFGNIHPVVPGPIRPLV